MRRIRSLLGVVTILSLHPATSALASPPIVAAVSISTPAESLEARNRLRRSPDHASPDASPLRATLLSLGATAVPIATGAILTGNTSHNLEGGILIGAGVLLGPAVGYFDAGLRGRGTTGLLLRFGVTTVSFGAATIVASSTRGGDIEDLAGAYILVLGGAALTTVLAAADCALVGSDVARAKKASVSLAPAVTAPGAPGVALTVRF